MRELARIVRILTLIRQIWCAHPDWGFGQLLENVTGLFLGDMFFIEDDMLEKLLKNFLEKSGC